MLVLLRVAHLALIESLDVEFSPGLNVLTGETGAGKSILLEALDLLLGERAAPGCIRRGADRAEVEAVFDLRVCAHVRQWLDEQGLLSREPDELVLRREIMLKGRSRAWINGRLVTVGQFADLGALLAEIHGQHQAYSLLRPARQRELLDAFGGHEDLCRASAAAWKQFSDVRARLEALDADDREWRQRLDFLEYQIAEIDALGLSDGEQERLAAERQRLAHVGALTGGVARVLAMLSEGDDASALDLVGQAQHELEALVEHDAQLSDAASTLDEVAARLADLARELSSYASRLEDDPERLAEIEDRLEAIRRLERKHGQGTAAILESLAAMRAEAAALANRDSDREQLAAKLAHEQAALAAAAAKLSRARQSAARTLERRMRGVLKDLALPAVRFEVALPPREAPGPEGAEAVEFHFSANAGEEMKPLREVASGGELSRVMLALYALGAEKDRLPLLVFDEIDTGLSGNAARQVAGVLGQLARAHQILCVTHQPTIASRAARHFVVSKSPSHGRTVTRVENLEGDSRRREVARLLDGSGGAKSLELAEELLVSGS